MTIKTPDIIKTPDTSKTKLTSPPDFGLLRTLSGPVDYDTCSHGISSSEFCPTCKNFAINAIARMRTTSVSNTD